MLTKSFWCHCALLFLLAQGCALADGPYALPWAKVKELWITPSQARMYGPGAVQSLIGTDSPAGCQEPGTWCRADLKPFGVPDDAKFAFLTGLLIITHGTGEQLAAISLTFRQVGDTSADCDKMIAEAVETRIGSGQRSGVATWVPVTNGTVEYCFNVVGQSGWPDWSAFGLNLSVQAWGK